MIDDLGPVELIGASGRATEAEMQAFVDEFGLGDVVHVADVDGALWASFGVFTQPAWAFVDDSGTVELHLGGLGADGLVAQAAALAEA